MLEGEMDFLLRGDWRRPGGRHRLHPSRDHPRVPQRQRPPGPAPCHRPARRGRADHRARPGTPTTSGSRSMPATGRATRTAEPGGPRAPRAAGRRPRDGTRRGGSNQMSAPAVIVISAGPAGLAAAAALGREGIPAAVLEQADSAAASWLGRYDRLRLNTCRWTSRLPHSPLPGPDRAVPVPRRGRSATCQDYAHRHALEIRVSHPGRADRPPRRVAGSCTPRPARRRPRR